MYYKYKAMKKLILEEKNMIKFYVFIYSFCASNKLLFGLNNSLHFFHRKGLNMFALTNFLFHVFGYNANLATRINK